MKETLSDNSLKISSILLSSPHEQNLHTLAAAANLSVMGVSKIVKQLKQKNIVTITSFGKSHLIKINKSLANLLTFALAEQHKYNIFFKEHSFLQGFMIQLREKLINQSEFSLVFGSYASGEESTKSDLDFLIVSSHKTEVLKILKTVSVLLRIELSPVVITAEEFVQKIRQKHRLYREIADGKHILISGEYEYWKLVMSI